MLCGWGILNGLFWAVPLLGDNWWNKIWHGMGVNKLTIVLGLFNMEMSLDCTDSVNTSLCSAVKKYADKDSGHWAILELSEAMCKNVPDSCPTMTRLYQAGWAPLCLLPMAAALEVLAILMLYFYWHGKPTALCRNLANKLGVMAPIVGLAGFAGWMAWSPYMQELPRWWAAENGNKEFANNSVFGLKESFTLPTGWCVLMLFFGIISSGIRFFCQFTLPFHINEPDPYQLDESSRLMAEAEKLAYDDSK